MNELGYFKGEACNRNGCKGIIEEHEKEGSCTCHINPPCTYCTTPSEYCPECGWDAKDEQAEYLKEYSKIQAPTTYQYKADEQLFNELKDGEFGYIHVVSGGHTIVRLKGKHPNMTAKEIYTKLNLHENPHMPRMKLFTETEFELTYFCD